MNEQKKGGRVKPWVVFSCLIFGVPLLRLDVGALYNKFHGETERNLRSSLATAEAMAPCVLWLDEIEKGLADGSDDQGVGQRVMGTLLTWMSERESGVLAASEKTRPSRAMCWRVDCQRSRASAVGAQ